MNQEERFPNNVVDIKFSKGKAYILKEINLTSAEIEKQLSCIIYTGENRKKSDVVERAKLPPFILAFYELLFERNKVPSEVELTEYYERKYLERVDENYFKCTFEGKEIIIDKEGLEGRLLRTYPSLIRDFHFYLKCTEFGEFEEVKYSLNQDYFKGIDLELKYKGRTFGTRLSVNSERANEFKDRKNQRHNYILYSGIIIVIYLKRGSKMISNFSLYSDENLEQLLFKIKDSIK